MKCHLATIFFLHSKCHLSTGVPLNSKGEPLNTQVLGMLKHVRLFSLFFVNVFQYNPPGYPCFFLLTKSLNIDIEKSLWKFWKSAPIDFGVRALCSGEVFYFSFVCQMGGKPNCAHCPLNPSCELCTGCNHLSWRIGLWMFCPKKTKQETDQRTSHWLTFLHYWPTMPCSAFCFCVMVAILVETGTPTQNS